jgi:hypothetical protein
MTPARQAAPCRHRQTVQGPRVPARWGSFATEVCIRCLRWRELGSFARFRTPTALVRALIPVEGGEDD